jgi:hypothetical protein
VEEEISEIAANHVRSMNPYVLIVCLLDTKELRDESWKSQLCRLLQRHSLDTTSHWMFATILTATDWCQLHLLLVMFSQVPH